jgi:glyoxylase-like metal-dependent hydrolase (beta-lactamase superfamily II)
MSRIGRLAPAFESAAVLACLAVTAFELPRSALAQDLADVEIRVQAVRDNVFMLVGAGGNTTVQVGDDGVLVVDTQFAEVSGRLLAAIRALSDQPIRYVVNTHAHGDHVGGNAAFFKAGATITGGNVAGTIGDAAEGARVLAHENVLTRMSQQDPPPPFDAWPTDTYIGAHKDLYFNAEAVRILYQPAAHTDGDSIVFFRRADVISAGDVFSTTLYPVIDLERGGSVQGILDALNTIIEIAVPADKQEGGTMIIPGHGRLCDEADVVEYRDMLTIVRDRIGDMIEQGMSLRQVKAARPTADYDGRYGSDTGFWTTENFIEAAYASLSSVR